MALIKCVNGHFYDEKKYDSCPHCKNNKSEGEIQRTVYKDISFEDISNIQYTQMYSENGHNMDKTIGIYGFEKGNVFVTGWLIVLKGKQKGKSYPLHYGKNLVGRSLHMDVSLSEEEMITRDNHFSIIFENKECAFYIVEGTAPIMLNKTLVSGYERLKENDIISVADVEMVFVPYCKKGREWDA